MTFSFTRKIRVLTPSIECIQEFLFSIARRNIIAPSKSQELWDEKADIWTECQWISLEEGPRLKIYLSLSQRASWTQSHCEWIFDTAIWMILFVWQGPWAFVNSLRGGFLKSWRGEKPEKGEIRKNTVCVVNSGCCSSPLSTAYLPLRWRFLTILYPCVEGIKM